MADGSEEKVKINRLQLPIQPTFAVTGHSTQGKTLPKVMVDLSERGFAAYVAASRARTREGLFVTSPVTLQHLNKPLPFNLLTEVRHFEVLQHNTYIRYGLRPGNEVTVPDPEAEHGGIREMRMKLDDASCSTPEAKRKHEDMLESTMLPEEIRPDDSSDNLQLPIPPQKRTKKEIIASSVGEPPRLTLINALSPLPLSVGC